MKAKFFNFLITISVPFYEKVFKEKLIISNLLSTKLISNVKYKTYAYILYISQRWTTLHCSLIIFDFLEAHDSERLCPSQMRGSSFLNRVSTRSVVSRWSLSPRQHGNERKSVCLGQLHGRWTTTCLARWWCASQSIQCRRFNVVVVMKLIS